MIHTNTTLKTSVGEMKPSAPTWPGTPAEWDAERDRLGDELYEIWRRTRGGEDAFAKIAAHTMPPRPVEPPSVVTASGWTVTWLGERFAARHPVECANLRHAIAHYLAHDVDATESEHDAIRALRDGPTPQYEPDEGKWRVKSAEGHHYNTLSDESNARELAKEIGGTAHAIYKRVGGA